jgi:DNA processing protein
MAITQSQAAPSQEEQIHWLALTSVPGLGSITILRILERFRNPQAVFRASASELEASGLSPAIARSIASGIAFEDAADQHERMLRAGVTLLSIQDQRYPALLREIFDPPAVLFAKGRLELLERHGIAIVGTRRPTPYGVACAGRLAGDLAKAGLTIVSGMARGIDTTAHQAALEVNGDTIAVFGCGIDQVYPSENRRLYDQIAENGLLLSEFPMGSPAFPQNFPIRNRIISGISEGVLIIEGAQHSGSAITARLAGEHSREIFAIPGNITSKMSWGPNILIKQGAKLVQEWTDVTNELSAKVRRDLTLEGQQKILLEGQAGDVDAATLLDLDPLKALARKILAKLEVDRPQQLESLLESFDGVSSSEMIAALFDLELSGLVRQLPGKNFLKVW